MGILVSILFFLSGATGLIYEVVWAKYLSLVLGNTTHAYTVVLATFLGGLALGNAFWGPFADRVKNRLRVYAALEIGIGLLAIGSPYFLVFFSDLYVSLARQGAFWPFGTVSFRVLLSAVVLLPPTVLMGGTLPVLSRFATRSLGQMEGAVSWLYFLNSGGAVFGTLLAGFYLIPVQGLNKAIMMGGVVNLAIGIVCFSLKAREGSLPVPKSVNSQLSPARVKQIRIIYAAVFASGCISLTYEIAWIRLLSLVLGSSTYSFSVMLAAFIAGIALGGWLIAHRILPRLSSYLLFGLAELGIGLSILLTLPVYERLPYYFLKIGWLFNRTLTTFYLFEGIKFSFCFILMLLPTIFVGMTLPLASRVVTQSAEEVGKKVGSIFSVNTVGNVVGAVVAGLMLMPILGIQTLILAGVLANLLLGSIVILNASELARKAKIAAVVVGILGFAVSTLGGASWDKLIISSGEFRTREDPEYSSYKEYKKEFKKLNLLYYKDDSSMTVSVVEDDEYEDLYLKVNGKVDATKEGDLPTQILLGQLPLCLKPNTKDVFVVGLGSGITAGSVLRHPVERVDLAEISGAVVEAERYFRSYNYNVLQDPRFHLHIEDAKTMLRLTSRRYDVIISEPSNPWIAGIGNLFSIEFYREALAHLKNDGFMVQWFQLYEMSDDIFKMILRTFTSVFTHVTIWEIGNDVLLLGSRTPIHVDFHQTEAIFNQTAIKADLQRIGIHTVATLLSLQLASDDTSREMGGKGPINSDFLPLLEYQAPKAFYLDVESDLTQLYDERWFPKRDETLFLSRFLRERETALLRSEFKDMAEFHKESGGNMASSFIVEWVRRFPNDQEALWALAQAEREEENLESADRILNRLLEMKPENLEYLEAAADVKYEIFRENQTFLSTTRPQKALAYYERLLNLDSTDRAMIYFKMARVYESFHEYQKAIDALKFASKEAVNDDETGATLDDIWLAAAKVAKKMENHSMAQAYARKALNHNQDNYEAANILKELSEQLSADGS